MNFINFPLVLIIFFIHSKKLKNIDSTLLNLIILLSFLIIASGLINFTGIINIILQILLYVSFFLFFIVLVATEWSEENINFFKKGLATIFIINILFSYFQIFIIGFRHDDVHGIALNLGTAAHLNGSICLISFLFFVFYFNPKNKILSYSLALINLPIIFFSDAKQIFVVVAFAWITIIIINIKFNKGFLKDLFWFLLGIIISYYIITSLIPMRSYENLIVGFEHKFSVLGMIFEKNTLVQFFLGIGPGQTISRLATESYLYYDALRNLGFVHSDFTRMLVTTDYFNYAISGSSFFSMKFSFAGILGDLGILGLITYILILVRINYKYSLSKIQSFVMVSFFYYGLTFTWLEEPIFMILYFSFFGFIWQSINYKNKEKLKIIEDN